MKIITAFCLFIGVVFGGVIKPQTKTNIEPLGLFGGVPRDQVTFRLWNREHPDYFRPIYLGHLSDEESIETAKPFKVLVHGWTDNADKGWYEDIIREYLKKGDFNVVGVDWREPASALYPLSVKYTGDVGKYVGEILVDLHETLGVSFENMHLIGHSLGAHISGLAGQYVLEHKKSLVGRITGLDPAGPLFLLAGEEGRLSSGDAIFVDIIHTDGGKLGMAKSLGHADFYPNGGSAPQPGCMMYMEYGIIDAASCSHTRSHTLFRESINSEGFVAKECESMKQLEDGNCEENKMVLMGDNADVTARGEFYLGTSSREPFAMNSRK